jgi:hypothetical protein
LDEEGWQSFTGFGEHNSPKPIDFFPFQKVEEAILEGLFVQSVDAIDDLPAAQESTTRLSSRRATSQYQCPARFCVTSSQACRIVHPPLFSVSQL